jgi:hypothetical protein
MTENSAPQFGISVMPKGTEITSTGKPRLMLVLAVSEAASQHQFYLCDADDNYQDVAQQFANKINEAGREARRAQSGLVVVKGGDSNGLRTEKQGRQQRGPRPAGT